MKSENFDPNDPIQIGYTLQGSMKGSADLVGKGYADVHTYMRKFGWDYSEHPNSSTKDHNEVDHIETVFDATINQYIFRFRNTRKSRNIQSGNICYIPENHRDQLALVQRLE